MRDPRRRPGARSRRLPPTLGLSLSALLASSGFLPSSALSFAPPRSAASRSVRASSSILRVVPIRTGDPPPYRPRYRPQDNPVLPPHSARPGKIEDDEYYTADVPPSAARTSSSSSYSPLGFAAASSSASSSAPGQRVTLTRFLSDAMQDSPELRDIESLLLSVQMACKTISHLVDRAGINQLSGGASASSSSSSSVVGGGGGGGGGTVGSGGATTDTAALARAGSDDPYEQYDFRLNSMKRLDQLSTNVLRNALRFTGKLQMVAPARDGRRPLPGEEDSDDGGEDVAEVMMDDGPADHQPGVLIAKALDGRYVACFDPLDGSGNADAAICTGTVFGVFETPEEPEEEDDEDAEAEGGGDDDGDDEKKKKKKKEKKEKRGVGKDVEDAKLVRSVLQPGRSLRAAGYCLYSSATILVLTTGDGTHGFTLDPQINEFVLTHPNIRIPPRGNVYSCNEANSEGWDDDLRSYLRALKTGQGQTGTRYALRYVGSMVGDIHRTLMYGGLFCYPSDAAAHPRGNLQLLYKSAPMAFVVEQAGGKSSDGRGELLDVVPRRVHQRSPCFIGSPEDIEEMKTFIPHEEG